ncbi:MAG: rhomboid family intramembrane serine protease [Bacteroidetes bacterium]|nr:rhomboid family intramembrane serine protease [Bacteroidota bacterium]
MFQNIPPITRTIILINVVVYLLTNLLMGGALYNVLSAYYPFSPNFRIWQILTHMFMHAPLGQGIGITHILFNMLTLWSFGPVLEQSLGQKKYLWLYFLSGIGSFLLFNLWNFYQVNQLVSELQNLGVDVSEIYRKSALNYQGDLTIEAKSQQGIELSRQLFMDLRSPMLGASGAIFGIVAAFATLFPDAKLMFMFIPFPIKAKVLLPIIIVVSIYLGLSGNVGGVAHFAHVGGAIVGYFMARYWKKNRFRIY